MLGFSTCDNLHFWASERWVGVYLSLQAFLRGSHPLCRKRNLDHRFLKCSFHRKLTEAIAVLSASNCWLGERLYSCPISMLSASNCWLSERLYSCPISSQSFMLPTFRVLHCITASTPRDYRYFEFWHLPYMTCNVVDVVVDESQSWDFPSWGQRR